MFQYNYVPKRSIKNLCHEYTYPNQNREKTFEMWTATNTITMFYPIFFQRHREKRPMWCEHLMSKMNRNRCVNSLALVTSCSHIRGFTVHFTYVMLHSYPSYVQLIMKSSSWWPNSLFALSGRDAIWFFSKFLIIRSSLCLPRPLLAWCSSLAERNFVSATEQHGQSGGPKSLKYRGRCIILGHNLTALL